MKPSLAPIRCSTSMIGRFAAMAPLVAKVTDRIVAASIRIKITMTHRDRGIGHRPHAVDEAAMIVEARARDPLGQELAQSGKIGCRRPARA